MPKAGYSNKRRSPKGEKGRRAAAIMNTDFDGFDPMRQLLSVITGMNCEMDEQLQEDRKEFLALPVNERLDRIERLLPYVHPRLRQVDASHDHGQTDVVFRIGGKDWV